MKTLIVILILVSWVKASAQDVKQDTVKSDTTKSKYIPTGIRVGTDAISLIKSSAQNNFKGWEIQGDIDFDRYYLTMEYGYSARNIGKDSTSYSNHGKFWRVGVDVNFLMKDPDRNMFFIGLRYGHSVFSERMDLISVSPEWGTLTGVFENRDVNARWLELTSGIRVKIWKVIWLGYTGRLKFALKTDAVPEMLPYDVPGFGTTDKDTTWGFNYYVMLRIPLRKAPVISLPKK